MDFIFQTLKNIQFISNKITNFLIVTPLKTLYFDGPTILGIGFWEKLPAKDICSRLTGVSATFWDKYDSLKECKDLVDRKFDTFIVGTFTISYIWFTYKLISYLLFRLFVIRPITNELKEEFRKFIHQTVELKK